MRVEACQRSRPEAATARGGRGRGAQLTVALAAAALTSSARTVCTRLLLFKLRRDVRALNAGDIQPLLSGFAEDAVLRFNDGEHRWAGEHRGTDAIAAFLRSFVDSGLRGQVTELFVAGPLWRLTLIARFDDQAHDATGTEIYRNRTVLLARARWGRIVSQEDFYEDTQRIVSLEQRLREREARRPQA
jgi:ketosteroid isomerase-like protein